MRGVIRIRQRIFYTLLILLTILGGGCARDLGVKPRDPWKSAPVALSGSAEAQLKPGVISPASRGILAATGWNGKAESLEAAMRPLVQSREIQNDPARARAVVEGCLFLAERANRARQDARGTLFCALRVAHPFVVSSPMAGQNRVDFEVAENFCVSRLAAELGHRLNDVARSASVIQGPFETYKVEIVKGSGEAGVAPALFEDLEACDEHQVVNSSVVTQVDGTGTPLLGRVKGFELTRKRKGMQPLEGFLWPVTATVTFSPTRNGLCHTTVALYDPRLADSGRVGPRREKLAADYTTPIAVTATAQRRIGLGMAGLFHGDKYFSAAGLYPTQPYSPKKMPVILIHGLLSDQDTWAYLLNAIYADESIRHRYQFWVFYYPTSLPVPYSALVLREQIEAIQKREPNYSREPALNRTVMVGHSMGGLLTRFAISSSGDTLYREYFRKPIDELNLTPELRERLRRTMYFKPLSGVSSAVFIATPQRGSGLARHPIADLARVFVRLPSSPKGELVAVFDANRASEVRPIGARSGLDSMRPDNEIYRALPNMPISSRVRCHSIIGNRGDGRSVGSSDGVVPYSSSHLDGVASEILVPAGHSGTLKRPETATELRRILKENAQGLKFTNRKSDLKPISR
jgi:pimeloyl-ACP methyl ester carboxylesterase